MAYCITCVLLEEEAWASWPGRVWLLPPEQCKHPWEEATLMLTSSFFGCQGASESKAQI